MSNFVKSLPLTGEDTAELESILRRSTIEARTYIRAKILLMKADGYSNEYIADKLDITIPTVRLCIQKYTEGGINLALQDSKGRGRKPEITDADIIWVINKACQKPREYGYAAELWYPTSFTHFINSIADEEGHPRMATVTETTLRKIMANVKIRPFKVTYYCERRNSGFDSIMHEFLIVYKQVSLQFDEDGNLKLFEETPAHTLSYDEKPGFQSIGTTKKDRIPIPNTDKNSSVYWHYEDVRYGTLSLLTAIDLLTGEAIPYISFTYKSCDFVCFLKKLDEEYPAGDKLRLILDNYLAHTSQETQRYLNTVPGRFEFVFTPSHGSWLNMVEGFFSKMAKQMLNGIRVTCKEELENRIYQYFEEINQEPVPYHWSYNLDDIDIAKEDMSKIIYEVNN